MSLNYYKYKGFAKYNLIYICVKALLNKIKKEISKSKYLICNYICYI